MTQSNSVVILGAGAMGGMFASLFYEKDPSNVTFIASGERYLQLTQEGLVINGRQYSIPVLSPEDTTPPADLVLVALKHHHLHQALPDLKPCIGEDTVILSVMNGLDSEEIIASYYGEDKLVYAVSVGTDPTKVGNKIEFSNSGTLFFGEAQNTTLTERVKNIQALFDRTGIKYQTPEDMVRTMWWKFMINVGINQTSSILGAPYETFQKSEHARSIMESAMREVISIARVADVDVTEKDIKNWYGFLNALNPESKTSMLQDIEAGRTTEVDIFAGKVIALGKQYGVATPINELLFHAIKVIEGLPA